MKFVNLKKRFTVLAERLSFGRVLLGVYASAYARYCKLDALAFFDGTVWLHRINGRVFADGFSYPYDRMAIRKWGNQCQITEEISHDYWFHEYTPCAGDVVVDAGAGTGEDTLIFSKIVGQKGKVLTVEAHPKTFVLLEHMCHHNKLSNVILENKALMDKAGSVCIEDTDQWIGNSIVQHNDQNGHILSVDAISLDQLLIMHQIPRVDFVKMNIEGAERYALRGMEMALRNAKAVAIAAHDFRAESIDGPYRTREEVKNLLKANGFRISTRPGDPRPWIRDTVYGIK